MTYRKLFSIIIPWFALALGMNLVRYYMSDLYSYIYLNWNLFLGVLPLLFLFFFEKSKNVLLKGLAFFAWLLFLPNAHYIVTDFIHLRDVGTQSMLWFDGMMIFAYTLIALIVAVFTLNRMKRYLSKSILSQNVFLWVISALAAFGIYIGRYIRFNTWDILAQPMDLAASAGNIILNKSHEPVFVQTMIFFTLFIFISEYSFRAVLNTQKKEA